jgi:trehalose 6-phosphate synthase/phosphatase
MAETIIVSNRLPVSVRKVDGKLEFYPSSGGLATSMSDLAKRRGSVWVGWPGIVSEELTQNDKQKITEELAKQNCKPVFLTRRQFEGFYNGYSNSVLWPHMHNMSVPSSIPPDWWKAYKEANQLFAEAAGRYISPKSTVWVHDYQLLLVPQLLRRQNARSSIGFFLHIPFPDAEHFLRLKEAESLTKGLLGADLVGFHTQSYVHGFLETANNLGIGVTTSDQVILPSRTVRVADFPIGINYKKFSHGASSRAVRPHLRKLNRKYGQYKTILTVDRLDPTKAFPERLRAYETLLAKNPHLHRKVVMLMIAVPSRTEIEAYQKLRKRVDELVERINRTFGTKDWQPIHIQYPPISIPFEELSALYQFADIAFIAPLKDGMNLVAKEYVASKQNGHGALILSQTAGAAEELEQAILVNPQRQRSLVSALNKALTMPPAELQKRLNHMQQAVENNGVQRWASSFMKGVKQSATKRRVLTLPLTMSLQKQVVSAYRAAKHPLLLLDYDGVLTPFFDNPSDSEPSAKTLEILRKLSQRKQNEVAIVSGRSKDNLETWLGKLPLILVSEHGAKLRLPGKKWQTLVSSDTYWKPAIRILLEEFANITPGAFIEEKSHSLVWHYRAASPYYAQKNLVIMRPALRALAKEFGLGVYQGNKIIEVKPPQLNKGAIVDNYLAPKHDFILAIGDDYTDEYLFAALPETAYTVKVGFGTTVARYRLKDVNGVLKLLTRLAQ